MEHAGHFLSSIDWRRPWLAPLLPTAKPILAAQDWRQAINDSAEQSGLRNHQGLPIRFVHQEELPPGMAYEAFIGETGCVPTRENLHDFFNALVWLTYPQIKIRLNALQAAEIASASASSARPAQRGNLRDAATIFDENAALLISCDAAVTQSLREHRWQEAFMAQRLVFGNSCEVRLFGHALMEKLASPYKAITAHAWVVMVEASYFALNDAQKKAQLGALVTVQLSDGLKTSDFTPLPVLGVPGWWELQDDAFYGDSSVFRPKRASKKMA